MCSISSQVGGANLLHELLGFLRRCLTQQAEVRSVLYQVGSLAPLAPEATLVPLTIGCASCLLGSHNEPPTVDPNVQHSSDTALSRWAAELGIATGECQLRVQQTVKLRFIAGLQGMCAILSVDSTVQQSMLELVLPHVAAFLPTREGEVPPLKLDQCAKLQVSSYACHGMAS